MERYSTRRKYVWGGGGRAREGAREGGAVVDSREGRTQGEGDLGALGEGRRVRQIGPKIKEFHLFLGSPAVSAARGKGEGSFDAPNDYYQSRNAWRLRRL